MTQKDLEEDEEKRREGMRIEVVCNFLESCDFGPTSHSPPIGHQARDSGEPEPINRTTLK